MIVIIKPLPLLTRNTNVDSSKNDRNASMRTTLGKRIVYLLQIGEEGKTFQHQSHQSRAA